MWTLICDTFADTMYVFYVYMAVVNRLFDLFEWLS